MTPAQIILDRYFHEVESDPRIRAAWPSLQKLASAFFWRLQEDVPVVLASAVKNKAQQVAPVAGFVGRSMAEGALGGKVSREVVEKAGATVEAIVKDGLAWLGGEIGRKIEEHGKRRRP